MTHMATASTAIPKILVTRTPPPRILFSGRGDNHRETRRGKEAMIVELVRELWGHMGCEYLLVVLRVRDCESDMAPGVKRLDHSIDK